MTQDDSKQALRPWAGEALWGGAPPGSRTVEVAADGAGRYRATGQAGQAPAFAVALREDQLRRFLRQVERDGATWHGPPGADPGQEPPFKWGPIGDQGDEKPPPTRPTVAAPDAAPLLLLADAERRRPVLPEGALDAGAVARVPRLDTPLPSPERYGDPGGNPNDLARQRWGVIAPRGPAGDALLEAVRPLVELRAEQQGAPVRTYRVAPGGGIAEANDWARTVYLEEGTPEEERPRYLLILGD